MLVSDVITAVRLQLRDVVSGAYVWTDTEMVKYVDMAQKKIFRDHPEAAVLDSDTEITATYSLTDLTATSDTIALNDQFLEELVSYTVKMCSEVQSNFTDNASASYLAGRHDKNKIRS